MDQNKRISPFPRAVRPVPEPLGLYLNVGRNDHKALSDLLASGGASVFGAVLDPSLLQRHGELRDQILEHNIDAVLNPKTQESATPGGYKESLGRLPWGVGRPHILSDFEGTSGRRIILAIAQFALDQGFTQVMAPTHLLRSADDPWFLIDIDSTRRLRDQLDRKNGPRIPVVYSLAIPYSTLRDAQQRRSLIERLKTSGASSIWLKVEGAGSSGSATQARNYIDAAREMHELGVPLVAEHIGGLLGMSLLAFGAVGGMAHGITLGERFDAKHWRQPAPGRGFLPANRVYIRSLDLMIEVKQARQLMETSPRVKAHFGCKDTHCCPRGVLDMITNPARHFIYQRANEVSELSLIPEQRRPQHFLERSVRPASDMAVSATNVDWGNPELEAKMKNNRKRLDTLRVALSAHAETRPTVSYALHPERRATRASRC